LFPLLAYVPINVVGDINPQHDAARDYIAGAMENLIRADAAGVPLSLEHSGLLG